MKVMITFAAGALALFMGCDISGTGLHEASAETRAFAADAVESYLGVPYAFGGADWYGPRHIGNSGGVDCSGLVINVYRFATGKTGQLLPFEDATVATLHMRWTKAVTTPERGDLIFMGEESVDHVAIFDHEESGMVYFTDAYSVDGMVERRSYPLNSPKLMGYARMLVH